MEGTPEEADHLQARAEQWQTLVTRQQDLALQLSKLTSEQRELANLWDDAGVEELAAQARQIEEEFRALETKVLRLEEDAVDKLANTISQAARILRPEFPISPTADGPD